MEGCRQHEPSSHLDWDFDKWNKLLADLFTDKLATNPLNVLEQEPTHSFTGFSYAFWCIETN